MIMDIKGLWKADKVLSFDENFDQVWKDAEAILNDPTLDEDDKQAALTVIEIGEDGILRMMIPLPDGISQEEIDAAVEEGEIEVVGDMMVVGKHEWKEEDGKFFFDSGIQGEVLGEEVSPWEEIIVTDDGIQLFTFKMVRA